MATQTVGLRNRRSKISQESVSQRPPVQWGVEYNNLLKALSAKVVRAAPNDEAANKMRAEVLSGICGAWEEGPRSAAELKKAATHYDRAAVLCRAPAVKALLIGAAGSCRSQAEAM